ncbi:MFS transporter [Nakamurella deserti]|uniref:MFS transporter n=1 Tax=Nakamurella deserti TaxID=2164074 RepID=UPI00130069C8|nr:MFS transporter [Nakamurella deserti]
MTSNRRARLAVSVLFLLVGLMIGSWAARIPGVRSQVVVDDAQWGLILLAAPLGTLTALVVVTRLIPRVGSRLPALTGALLVLLVVPATTASQQVWVLMTLLLLQGFAAGLVVTPMNALAVHVERAARRRIMSTFHACFSLGQLSGAGIGAAAAALGVSPVRQLLPTALVMLVAFAATRRWIPQDRPTAPPVRAAKAAAGPRTMTPQLVLLAAIALLSSISEGAAVQWSAQYGAVTVGAGAGVGALVLSCFSIAMTTSRLFGDRVVGRLGQVRFIRASALTAAVGMAVGLGVGTTWGAFVGFLLLGVGCACLVPTVYGLAGNQPGLPPGRGVAVVSFGQWPAYLVGPPLIGALAGLTGLRGALGVTVVAGIAVAVLAGRIHEPDVAVHRA